MFQEVGGPCGRRPVPKRRDHIPHMHSNWASAACAAHTQIGVVSQEGSMVPDASKSWNVPACKQADNVKQLYRSARHGGLQKLVVERSIVLGMPAEQAHARGKGAHMRRERVGQRGAARQKQREHGWVESEQGSRLLEWLDEAWLPNQLLSKPLSRPSKNIKRLSGCAERHFATRR